MFRKENFKVKVFSSKFLAAVLAAGMCVSNVNAMFNGSLAESEVPKSNVVSYQVGNLFSARDDLYLYDMSDEEFEDQTDSSSASMIDRDEDLSLGEGFGERKGSSSVTASDVAEESDDTKDSNLSSARDDMSDVDFEEQEDSKSVVVTVQEKVFAEQKASVPVAMSCTGTSDCSSLSSTKEDEISDLQKRFRELSDRVKTLQGGFAMDMFFAKEIELPKSMRELVQCEVEDETISMLYRKADHVRDLWFEILSKAKTVREIYAESDISPLSMSMGRDEELEALLMKERSDELRDIKALCDDFDVLLQHVKEMYLHIYRTLLQLQKKEHTSEESMATRFDELPNSYGRVRNFHPDENIDRYSDIFSIRQLDGRKEPRQIMPEYVTKGGKIINATKIMKLDGFSLIATQAPKIGTFDDFLDLLYTSGKVDGVVVLGPAEAGWWQTRIPAYFIPNGIASDHHGEYACTSSEDESFVKEGNGANKYMMRIKHGMSDDGKVVPVYHFSGWPDRQLPINREHFKKFASLFTGNRKLVVHCSAGIGRTGVFAAYLYALRTGERDPFKIVAGLRQYRVGMVQTPVQFEFLCELLKELEEQDKK